MAINESIFRSDILPEIYNGEYITTHMNAETILYLLHAGRRRSHNGLDERMLIYRRMRSSIVCMLYGPRSMYSSGSGIGTIVVQPTSPRVSIVLLRGSGRKNIEPLQGL